ncbi:MAG TPA: preprotein translocase subunit TatB [Clostridiaceae bacterium]|nr:preprotein translocase subunit TatB [Clostridiaceae bacterium]
MEKIDACGLSCPEPLLLVRNAVAAGAVDIEVKVDDPTPRENIIRFADNRGLSVEEEQEDGIFILKLTKK